MPFSWRQHYSFLKKNLPCFTVSELPECTNAVSRDESWRLYNEDNTLEDKSCDHKQLMSNSTWYKFDHMKMMEKTCTDSKDRYDIF